MKQKRPFHVMIIPTLGCPSKCAYCWSSEVGSPIMSIETVKDTVAWLKDFRSDPVTFTFHGGEPLLAGADFYRQALPLLTDELQHLDAAASGQLHVKDDNLDFAMQRKLLQGLFAAACVKHFHAPHGQAFLHDFDELRIVIDKQDIGVGHSVLLDGPARLIRR